MSPQKSSEAEKNAIFDLNSRILGIGPTFLPTLYESIDNCFQ